MAKIKPIDAKEIKVDGLGKVRPEAYSEVAEFNKSGFPFRYFRLCTVCEITGLSKTTVYEYSKTDPEFPKPVKLGASCTAWRSDELAAWMMSRPRADLMWVAA